MSESGKCTSEELAAFWKIGQIKEIIAPGFAYRVNLAREEGLLDAILAGQTEEVRERASKSIAALSVRVRWRYPPGSPHSEMRPEDQPPDLGSSAPPDTVSALPTPSSVSDPIPTDEDRR